MFIFAQLCSGILTEHSCIHVNKQLANQLYRPSEKFGKNYCSLLLPHYTLRHIFFSQNCLSGTLLPTLLSLLGRLTVKTANLDTQNQKFTRWFLIIKWNLLHYEVFIFVNDVIIASKIHNSLNLYASASTQNILLKVFRKKCWCTRFQPIKNWNTRYWIISDEIISESKFCQNSFSKHEVCNNKNFTPLKKIETLHIRGFAFSILTNTTQFQFLL